ncbi:hypothetical protein PZ61_0235635 [Streptomyces sp. MNU77]|uniref:sugar phosphate isomerase/epimerase family protein n=1 Tax=Streptomyces sp. MNU77 TaxID=1573406 RepID=UPI0005E34883|nr:sugar phosphate isomerase/epimerase family protein [Streptomyces sp. MNU77]OLO26060.1 hypothetical protein PZ61_0235635 [Streptomyces sp. MNU77]
MDRPSRHPFADRAAAAAAAGFTGIGLTVLDYDHLRALGRDARSLHAIAEDHGIAVTEVEFLNGWWATGDRLAADRAAEERLYELADAVSAHHVNVGASVAPDSAPPRALLVERFADLCDRAAAHGLLAGLEYMPFFTLADAPSAWDVVREADRPNGGLVVDAFHHLTGPHEPDVLYGIPADRIVAVQLCDARPDPGRPLLEQAVSGRLWPGSGTLDVAGLVAVLDRLGVTAPVGVEVLSARVRGLPLARAAREAADSARAVLGTARRRTP